MCTSVIYRDLENQSIFLGFNRDESVKRKKAISPSIEKINDVEVLCPKDGDYGGTWIGVNSTGEIFAILNFYEAQLKILRNPVSRGLLLRSVLFKEIALDGIDAQGLVKYYPFRIIKINYSTVMLFEWNGESIHTQEDAGKWQVFGSSFTLGKKAEIERRRLFEEKFLPDIKNFQDMENTSIRFLTSHIPEAGALSPCMHRREARTVSQTLITLRKNVVSMKYKNSPPCETEEFENFSMPIVGH
ncbi:MAG: NRDE family protein [Leptospiraceae bacterium]|nr:NRDE family protein [Leptospiraceae bacterium]MCK6380901.1 NRDE family protein [Leptospiraceae bacterium]NUM40044.1 NRDE family protein [Leptospiraceae bacterium]